MLDKSSWVLNREYNFRRRIVKWDRKGEGRPVVLIHGTPWSSFNLRHLINDLANDHSVFYFDLLGYGQSDKSNGDVSLGIQNEVLAELINYWNLENPVVIGHDFGGTTVLRTHLINNVPYAKLILIDPVAIAPWGSAFFQHVRKHETAFAGMPDYIHAAVVEAYVRTAAHKPLAEETIKGILNPWLGISGKAAFYRQIAQADEHFTDEIQPHYENIQIPTLIVWGEKDTWIPVDKGEKLHELINGSQLYKIPDTGHLVIEERPDLLVQKIREFIL